MQVYTNDHGIKLNEVVEFFGFITYDNAQQVTMSSTAETIHDQLQQEFLLGHPSAQIPRVHCIGIVKVGHNNPLLPSANPWVDHPRKKNFLINFFFFKKKNNIILQCKPNRRLPLRSQHVRLSSSLSVPPWVATSWRPSTC